MIELLNITYFVAIMMLIYTIFNNKMRETIPPSNLNKYKKLYADTSSVEEPKDVKQKNITVVHERPKKREMQESESETDKIPHIIVTKDPTDERIDKIKKQVAALAKADIYDLSELSNSIHHDEESSDESNYESEYTETSESVYEWDIPAEKVKDRSSAKSSRLYGDFVISEDFNSVENKVNKKAAVIIDDFKKKIAECHRDKLIIQKKLEEYSEDRKILENKLNQFKDRLNRVEHDKKKILTDKRKCDHDLSSLSAKCESIEKELIRKEHEYHSDKSKYLKLEIVQLKKVLNDSVEEKYKFEHKSNHLQECLYKCTEISDSISQKYEDIKEKLINVEKEKEHIEDLLEVLKGQSLQLKKRIEVLHNEKKSLDKGNQLGKTLETLHVICEKYNRLQKHN